MLRCECCVSLRGRWTDFRGTRADVFAECPHFGLLQVLRS